MGWCKTDRRVETRCGTSQETAVQVDGLSGTDWGKAC